MSSGGNPNHDDHGRFSAGDSSKGGASAAHARVYSGYGPEAMYGRGSAARSSGSARAPKSGGNYHTGVLASWAHPFSTNRLSSK